MVRQQCSADDWLTRAETPRNPAPDMTHTLCLDNCQTFGFAPNQFGVSVIRKAINGRTNRWQVTGTFQMTRDEARKFWTGLIKDGAFRA